MHSHICPFADILVIRAFVGILKASPTADVINKDDAIIGLPAFDIFKQFPQASSPGEAQTALAGIGIRTDDVHAVRLCIAQNDIRLIFSGILLMFCRHAHILRGGN